LTQIIPKDKRGIIATANVKAAKHPGKIFELTIQG